MRSRRKPVRGSACHHLRQRLARRKAHLDGADQLGRVVGVNASGRGSVEAREQTMQPRTSTFFCALAQPVAQALLARGPGKQPLGQSAKVESCSAGDDGQFSATGDIAQGCARLPAVFARSERLVRIGYVDQVMRQAGTFFFGWLGCAEVHAAIDGDRVATHDFAAEALTQCKRKPRLATAGGTEQQNGERV